ncbi:MAG: hypothetical protein HY825_04900 [Acidobacteria bacterium]|nr:hypothetical protein [Acidobacteriota bacterium]
MAVSSIALLAIPTLAGAAPTPQVVDRAPCRVSGALGLVPPPSTRGVEPSPFRYRGMITLTPAPRIQVYTLELSAADATCTCMRGLPRTLGVPSPRPFPWHGDAPQTLDVECSSKTKLKGLLGIVRIATSAEQAAPRIVGAPPLPECSGRFSFEQ